MQFKKDATVYTAEGEEVGEIERVVIDPNSKEVTHIVVRKGALFTDDKVIPIDLVASTKGNRLTLRDEVGHFEELPYFEVSLYLNLNQEEIERAAYPEDFAPPLYWYPSAGAAPIGYPGYPGQPHLVRIERNIPDYTIPLQEGARVVSADGEYVGNVDQIFTEPDDNQVTHFLISKGVLFEEHKLVPMLWVARVEEEEVHLVVGAGLLEDLPDYQK